ncbi:MAG: hypothetical protein BWY47_00595 [Bacteroidetes bacterium ADurb.Bin302]|nr:MAG: hypothetical protein BWY47_00595 [Bacteroidetes bacterium ADurb.Bin302]
MKIVTFISNAGLPNDSLTPTITIRNVNTKDVVISNEVMESIGDGFYYYEFDKYKEQNTYTVLVNAGDTVEQSERYQHSIIQDIDVNAAISFIKNIEGGMWEIKDNQMVFFGEDNKTEIAKFNLYNKTGIATEESVTKRTRYYEPTSGMIMFEFVDLSNKLSPRMIPDGIYTWNVNIDKFPYNISIPIALTHSLNDIISNIQIAIRNVTQKQETVYIDGNMIIIKSSTTGYDSEVVGNTGTLISYVFNSLGIFIDKTQTIPGYGTEGPQ